MQQPSGAGAAAGLHGSAARLALQDIDRLQLLVEDRLGIPRDIYDMVRLAVYIAGFEMKPLCLIEEQGGQWRCTKARLCTCRCCRPAWLSMCLPSPSCPPLQAGGVRVRQHVNPLKRELQVSRWAWGASTSSMPALEAANPPASQHPSIYEDSSKLAAQYLLTLLASHICRSPPAAGAH